jgi:probable F420-dependent oxidoreductase
MKWGTVFSSTSFPDPERASALATTAEDVGFESLWAPEHIVVPVEYDPIYGASDDGTLDRLGSRDGIPDPLIWFAFVAAQTKRIRFGTGVILLTERNLLHTAKEVATLDMLSKGRLMLGVGVGWSREEYEALGAPWPNRGKRMDEYIEAARLLWTEPNPSYDGEMLKFPPLECDPKPHDGPVPIHIGGTSEAACRRAGRTGDGYFPAIFPTSEVYTQLPLLLDWVRAGAKDAGRNYEDIEITSGGVRTAEEAKWFADQGVHRLTVAVRSKTISDMQEELKRFGGEVIEQTVDL